MCTPSNTADCEEGGLMHASLINLVCLSDHDSARTYICVPS